MIRIIVLGLISLLTTAAHDQPSSFCERLAPQLGMKPVPPSGKGAGTEWKVNLLGGLGTALFGGSTSATFGVESTGPATVEEYQRLQQACVQTEKGGLRCDVDGPVRLTVGTPKGKVSVDAVAGERATVEMRKTSIFCRAR